ncbi:XdhC family protein [uncultured Sneathiella sp.]|uniref:XdhC family protein n=1 Tax=uncultured Sneathiella sp. TaxID=879315 RepID=UPI002591F8A2|nr:XdhC family protein [uncultured Sneathiella sp.]
MTNPTTTLPEDDILAQALNWKKDGRKVALATVISTWGSAPRPAGSQLAIDETGQMVGSVSGGCVEGAVIQEALEIIKSGAPKTLEFGVSNDEAWEVGLACGGKINVFVEKLD